MASDLEVAEGFVSRNTRFDFGTPDYNRAVRAVRAGIAYGYEEATKEANPEFIRLRARVAELERLLEAAVASAAGLDTPATEGR